MIGQINVRISAGHVNMPLPPCAVFKDSAAAIAITDAPKSRSGATITGVRLSVTNAAGTTQSHTATLVGTEWQVVVPATRFAAAGRASKGLKVVATGTDRDGTSHDFILGEGDLYIIATDSACVNLGEYTNLRYLTSVPTSPVKGDFAVVDSVFQIYTGTAWTPASIGALPTYATDTTAWDATPTASSTKAVTSGGVKSAIDAAPRASLTPLGDGVWQMVDTGAGWVVEGGVVSWLAADKTAFAASEYYGHTTLTQVVAPNVTSVGDNAFYGCAALTTVSLPAATSVGDNAFYGCAALTTVSLPAATSIGDYAFYDCDALTSLSLPLATTIGRGVFSNTALTSLSLPLATTIGRGAFSSTSLTTLDLSSLTVATVTANASNWGIPSGCVVTCSDGTYTVPSAS